MSHAPKSRTALKNFKLLIKLISWPCWVLMFTGQSRAKSQNHDAKLRLRRLPLHALLPAEWCHPQHLLLVQLGMTAAVSASQIGERRAPPSILKCRAHDLQAPVMIAILSIGKTLNLTFPHFRRQKNEKASPHDIRAPSRSIGGQDYPNLRDWFAMVCMVWIMQTNGKPTQTWQTKSSCHDAYESV